MRQSLQSALHKPIAVFDAGIGSYAIVEEIRKKLPQQDILYLADRASFPYGSKSCDNLLTIMRKTLAFLASYDPSAIVIASNAPSIMVLDTLKNESALPLYGVFPPATEALAQSHTGKVGIMGVQSMIESPLLTSFIEKQGGSEFSVARINASPMVDLVENGTFLFSPEDTQMAINQFVDKLFMQHPEIDVLTLSSTHLPWLRRFFEKARPSCRFLDPAETVIAELGAGVIGTGMVQGVVTETADLCLDSFRLMLKRLGVSISLELVVI